ncbi:pre-rRNA-processing protein TSR2 homolog [Callorhinchus milii]|nr:pre-rRNA-processing protein TSR2 homolog [Callorhinchus milii]
MAAPSGESRVVFTHSVSSLLHNWSCLQIAVDNGFGGQYSQQKAEWMAGVLAQYFLDNADLDTQEVEDYISELMYNEFDTVIEDGSLAEVAAQTCTFYNLCCRGQEAEVRDRIQQLAEKRQRVRVEVTKGESPGEEEEEEEEEGSEDGEGSDEAAEAMDCDGHCGPLSGGAALPAGPSQPKPEEEGEADGWTVVHRKRK